MTGTLFDDREEMVGKISLKQVNRGLFFSVLICVVLYYGQSILIPVTFSIFFAMLFSPLCAKMEKRMRRGLAAFICMFILLLAILGIGLLIYMQASRLAERSDEIEKKSKELYSKAQQFVSEKTQLTVQKQDEVINKKVKEFMQSSGKVVKQFFSGLFGTLANFVLVLIFTFLFLLQRDKYEAFFVQATGGETRPDDARKMVHQISTVAQGYLTGRVISICIFTVLFTTGYLIVGLESAFLLAFVGALLTIIPYIGSILAGLFPVVVALVTAGGQMALSVLIVNLIVNILDNYIIEPNIIGGQVKISAFFTILILVVGGTLWGLAGMVLFLPMLGVLKIICDSVPELKNYGYLIGDQSNGKPADKIKKKLKEIFGKKSDSDDQKD